MSKGKLYLMATPINDQAFISESLISLLKDLLKKDHKIIVEDHKVARRKWLKWGLPRECIEAFILINEHSSQEEEEEIQQLLRKGYHVILMSDGGMPAFCDPGAGLIKYCHEKKISIEVPLADNSLMAALAMYGVGNQPFHFYSFPPKKEEPRKVFYQQLNKGRGIAAFMDAPYRLKKVVTELQKLCSERTVFIAYNITLPEGGYWQGKAKELTRARLPEKAEFVCIVDGNL